MVRFYDNFYTEACKERKLDFRCWRRDWQCLKNVPRHYHNHLHVWLLNSACECIIENPTYIRVPEWMRKKSEFDEKCFTTEQQNLHSKQTKLHQRLSLQQLTPYISNANLRMVWWVAVRYLHCARKLRSILFFFFVRVKKEFWFGRVKKATLNVPSRWRIPLIKMKVVTINKTIPQILHPVKHPKSVLDRSLAPRYPVY